MAGLYEGEIITKIKLTLYHCILIECVCSSYHLQKFCRRQKYCACDNVLIATAIPAKELRWISMKISTTGLHRDLVADLQVNRVPLVPQTASTDPQA